MEFNKNEKELLDSAINVLTDYFNSDSLFKYSKNGYELKTGFGSKNNNLFFENKNTKEHFGIRHIQEHAEKHFFTLRIYNNISGLPDDEKLMRFKVEVFQNNFKILRFTNKNPENGYDFEDKKSISIESNVMNKFFPKFRLLIELDRKLNVFANRDSKEMFSKLYDKGKIISGFLTNVSLSNYAQYLNILNNNLNYVDTFIPLLNQLIENKIDFLDSSETNKDLIEFKEFLQLCHDISLDGFNFSSNNQELKIDDLEMLVNDKSYEFYKEPKTKKTNVNKL